MSKTISILSYYSSKHTRGVESWASNLKKFTTSKINIISSESGEPIIFNAISKLYIWKNSDVVIPTNGGLQTLLVRAVTLIFKKPMIVFGHSGPGADDKWNLFCSPNVFVSFTKAQKDWVDKHKFPWTKSIVIPHAVDTDTFKPANRKPNKKIVLCVAANKPDKRINLVKNAINVLPGYKLRAIGQGNDEVAEFKDLPKIYKQADVFCFVPVPWEAFGLVFLEALSCNLPVVTSNDPIRKEIIGEAGLLVDSPESSEDLSKAIEKAYKTKWKNTPRERALNFSWTKTSKKYENLFSSL